MNLTVYGRLNIVALGAALSAVLVTLFVIYLLVALIFPEWPAAHGWIRLFSVAPISSGRVWVDGMVANVAFGWVSAIVLCLVYNSLIRRQSQ